MRETKVNEDVASAYAKIFKMRAGRIVLQDLVERFHIMDDPLQGNFPDREGWARVGSRRPVLHIMALSGLDIVQSARTAIERANEEAKKGRVHQ